MKKWEPNEFQVLKSSAHQSSSIPNENLKFPAKTTIL